MPALTLRSRIRLGLIAELVENQRHLCYLVRQRTILRGGMFAGHQHTPLRRLQVEAPACPLTPVGERRRRSPVIIR